MKQINNDQVLERRRELINKYYDVDEENHIVYFDFRFESIHDVIDENVKDVKHPKIKEDVIVQVGNKLVNIPKGYSTKINLIIKDYDGYDAAAVLSGLNDSLEEYHYENSDDNRRKWLKMMLLWFTGIGVLLLLLILDKFVLNTATAGKQAVIHEFVDIIAWAFIWEGVTVMFLTPAMYHFTKLSNIEKIKNVYLLDKEKHIIGEENHQQLVQFWEEETKVLVYCKIAMMIISGVMIAGAAISFVTNTIDTFTGISLESLITFGVSGAASLFEILAGLGGLFMVMGSRKLSRVSLIYGYIGAVIELLSIGALIFFFNPSFIASIVTGAFSFIVQVTYVILTYILRPKKSKEENK